MKKSEFQDENLIPDNMIIEIKDYEEKKETLNEDVEVEEADDKNIFVERVNIVQEEKQNEENVPVPRSDESTISELTIRSEDFIQAMKVPQEEEKDDKHEAIVMSVKVSSPSNNLSPSNNNMSKLNNSRTINCIWKMS